MSEHGRIRDLLGPFVLGVLGPDEEREVQDHLQHCEDCRSEEQGLRRSHEDLANLADAVETPPPELKSHLLAQLPRRRVRWAPIAAAAAAVLVLAVVAVYSSGFFMPEMVASAELEPTGLAPEAGGEVRVYETGSNMEVRLEVWGMPETSPDEYYELWLVDKDRRISAGSFTVSPDGRTEARLNAPATVLAEGYRQVGITSETTQEDPLPSGKKVLGGELDET